MFTSHNYRDSGVSVVIIDDVAPKAAIQRRDSDDAIFVQRLVEALSSSAVVKRTILANFEFALDWMPAPEALENSLFLVDVFAGSDKQPRGVAVIQLLRTVVCEDQIIIFSRAEARERSELFGSEHGYDTIRKGIGPDEVAVAEEDFWPMLLDKAVTLVEKKCKDPYLQSVGIWNEINRELNNWRGSGVLFPDGPPKHGVKWWIDHACDTDVVDELEHGRKLFAKLLRSCIQLSHVSVFCGLKAIWGGRASARLLCEVAGVPEASLTNFAIDRQLLSRAAVGVDAQALAGMHELLRSSEKTTWVCKIESVTAMELVILGTIELESEDEATKAATTLSKTPEERMKEPGREGRPGNGVTAAHKIRARASSLVFSSSEKTVQLRASFTLLGKLAEK